MKRLTMILLLLVLPMAAQAQRVVSRIEVRGNVPAQIVTSQTALVEGRSYSDKDLEVAMGRLRRLPFVFDARYSMDGDTLVIEIDSMSRLFADLAAFGSGHDDRGTGSARLGGGGRLFLGSGGVAQGHVAEHVFEGDHATELDAQYSHYGIAGTRFFAATGINYAVVKDGFDADPTFRVLVGYPLTVRQTLTADLLDSGFRSRRTLAIGPREIQNFSDQRVLNLRWNYDTTDDPFFTRSGETLNAGPTLSDESSQFESYTIFAPDGPVVINTNRTDRTTLSLGADARKYWATGTRGTIFGGLNLATFRVDGDVNTIGSPLRAVDYDGEVAAVSVGYGHNLFDWATRGDTRQRLEFGATYSRQDVDQPLGGTITIDGTSVNAGYVLRKQFATVRLNLSYGFN
jgi:hypothetical protein